MQCSGPLQAPPGWGDTLPGPPNSPRRISHAQTGEQPCPERQAQSRKKPCLGITPKSSPLIGHWYQQSGDTLQETTTSRHSQAGPTPAGAELSPRAFQTCPRRCWAPHSVGWSPQAHKRLCQPWGPPSPGALTHFLPAAPSLLDTPSLTCPLREEGHGKWAWNSKPGSRGPSATAPARQPHPKPSPFTERSTNRLTEDKSLWSPGPDGGTYWHRWELQPSPKSH